MTEHSSMNTIIHAAFRRDLTRFRDALAEFPAGSRARAAQLGEAWDNFDSQLHHHHQDEETIFFPAFRDLGVDEDLIHSLDSEHAAMAAALDQANGAMQALRTDPSADNVTSARSAIDQLTTVVGAHLDHEERDLEPFATQHSASPQFKRAQTQVRNAHKGGTGTFMAWLTDGADPGTLAALRKLIPPPVLFVLSRVAGRRYRSQVATTWTEAAT